MRILIEPPPNYGEICKTLSPGDTAVFTYGDTIYAPNLKDEKEIQLHLMVHEETHAKQQTNPEEWWIKYLADADFRFEQELEAYASQFAYVDGLEGLTYKNKKSFLEKIASDLASPMYGNIITQVEAESKIRNAAKLK